MNTQRDRSSMLRRLAAAVVAGTLALGASGMASAHGYDDGRHARKVVHHHYHGHGHHRKVHRGHSHRGHRGRKVVHVYHHDVSRYRPRPVVVEHHYPAANSGHHASGYGAYPSSGQVTPTLNAGSLMGAALGGLIGSQIGGGTGKLAATAAGTVGGFLIGDHTTRGYR